MPQDFFIIYQAPHTTDWNVYNVPGIAVYSYANKKSTEKTGANIFFSQHYFFLRTNVKARGLEHTPDLLVEINQIAKRTDD